MPATHTFFFLFFLISFISNPNPYPTLHPLTLPYTSSPLSLPSQSTYLDTPLSTTPLSPPPRHTPYLPNAPALFNPTTPFNYPLFSPPLHSLRPPLSFFYLPAHPPPSPPPPRLHLTLYSPHALLFLLRSPPFPSPFLISHYNFPSATHLSFILIDISPLINFLSPGGRRGRNDFPPRDRPRAPKNRRSKRRMSICRGRFLTIVARKNVRRTRSRLHQIARHEKKPAPCVQRQIRNIPTRRRF